VGAIFPAPVQTDAGVHPVSYKMGKGFLSLWISGRGVALKTHPNLKLRLKKE
jgi:hypothetical protein